MTTRYFYTDPLAAAWMAKHFGMRFEDDNPKSGKDWAAGKTLYYEAERYYIHPDSLHLLEPQVGDLFECKPVRQERRPGAWQGKYFESDEEYNRLGNITKFYNEIDPKTAVIQIIQRNGIAFMWPESEEA